MTKIKSSFITPDIALKQYLDQEIQDREDADIELQSIINNITTQIRTESPINFYWDNINGDDTNSGLSTSESVKTYAGLCTVIKKYNYGNFYPIVNLVPSTDTYSEFQLGTIGNPNTLNQDKIVLFMPNGTTIAGIRAYRGSIILRSDATTTNVGFLANYAHGTIYLEDIPNLVSAGSITLTGGGLTYFGNSNVTCLSIGTTGGGFFSLGTGNINCTSIYTYGGGYISCNSANITSSGTMVVYTGYIHFNSCTYRQTAGNMACIGGGLINFGSAVSVTGIGVIYTNGGGYITFNAAGSTSDSSKIQFTSMNCSGGGSIVINGRSYQGANNGRTYPTTIT
jgi:hypothetical protein